MVARIRYDENPLERMKKAPEKKINFSEQYEEDLKKELIDAATKSVEQSSNTLEYLNTTKFVHHSRPGEDWDVPLTEKVEYFDPELSYEITGYRPITMEKGLDFNPDLFRERAILYNTTGSYTDYPPKSKPYNDFWAEEFKRCKEGITIGKYRITGDHYFFLNYYRMFTILEDSTSGSGRLESFPGFLAKQYEFFHYVEMAEKLGKDVCILKARGLGLSEIVASLSVRPYTTNRGYHVMLTCGSDAKLTPLKNKCWKQLDWLNRNTNGGMRHVRQVMNNNDVKRASAKTKDGVEFGWGSEISSIVTDSADKVRGDRLDRLIYEEAGSSKNLTECWIKGDALVALGGKHFGSRVALGCVCAGTKVWTKEGKSVNIENLKKEDGIIGFHEGESYPEDIISLQDPAEKECVRIVTDFGDLECSEDHPIFTKMHHTPINSNKDYFNYDWVLARDLEGISLHPIIGICDKIEAWGNQKFFDPYLIGLLVGDGYYNNTPYLNFSYPEIKEYLSNRYTYTIDSRGRLAIPEIKEDLKKAGIYRQSKIGKTLPKNYFKISKEESIALLSGLFDACGKITNIISIKHTSEKVLLQSMQILNKLGIYGFIDNNNILYIQDTISLVNFAEQIPLKIKEKQVSLNKFLNLRETEEWRNYYKYKGIREAHILDVEHIGKKPIYNLTAGGSHTYLANNFITHNTGGDSMALEGLATMFTNPEAYNVLPYKNYDTDSDIPELSSFFLPAHKFSLLSEYLDSRGVTNHIEFRKFYEKQREKLTDNDYINECAEHCFTPREALSKHGNNTFDSAIISDRIVQIRTKLNYTEPKKVSLLWTPDSKIKMIDNPNSHLLIVEPPQVDEKGQVYKNLYVAGIDSIDIGSSESATDKRTSDFCIVIKKRIFGQNAPKYVAIYKERPKDIRTAYETCIKLLTLYNCKAMLEFSKVSIKMYFKDHGKIGLLMDRPKFAVGNNKSRKNLVGIQATEPVIKHGLELISTFLADYYYTIDFKEMLDQLLNYSYEMKTHFDIIAAMGMAEIGDEDMTGITPAVTTLTGGWKDIGYYIDERGYKRKGVIPNGTRNTKYNQWNSW